METAVTYEPIGGGIVVCTSEEHRFGTDAFLLTCFSRYRGKDLVCEFGTGCGIIPLLMQKKRPPRHIYALDIQEQAIRQLTLGIEASKRSGITPICTDLRNLWEDAPVGQCDLVVCNPPYQPCGSGYECTLEAQRIARHGVHCSPEDVCTAAARLLNFGGRLCVCGRPERLPDYICAMRQAGLEPKRLQFVSKTAESLPWLFLLEGKKGAKPFLQMEKPFIMYQNGSLTQQAAALYTTASEAESQ